MALVLKNMLVIVKKWPAKSPFGLGLGKSTWGTGTRRCTGTRRGMGTRRSTGARKSTGVRRGMGARRDTGTRRHS